MTNSEKLFEDITKEITAQGQLFETREVVNGNGQSFTEYASFPDSLKAYFDFALLHGDKEFLVYENERFTFNDANKIAAKVGNALISEGISKGDTVAICMQIIQSLFLPIWEL